MAKKTQSLFNDEFYFNEENHPFILKIFSKIKPDITIFQAIAAHKKFCSDPTKLFTEEELTEYFNQI